MNPKKKYLILPGYVISKNDGQRHFIGAGRLMDLYRVNPAECFVQEHGGHPIQGVDIDQLVALGPRYDGDYRLPAPPKA